MTAYVNIDVMDGLQEAASQRLRVWGGVPAEQDVLAGTSLGGPLPTGGSLGRATLDGQQVQMAMGTDHGRSVALLTVDLDPGQSSRLVVTMSTGVLPSGEVDRLELRTTPLSTQVKTSIGPAVACGA